MDTRAQEIFRAFKANPGDPELEARAKAYAQRCFVDPAERFQAALQKGGALERALVWEMEFSRISVQLLNQGGLLSCRHRFSDSPIHIRVWYPTLADIMKDFLPDDVRIVIQASYGRFSDLLESLEGYFPGATIVSAQAARACGQSYAELGYWRPKRRDLIDPKALAEAKAVEGSTGYTVAGRSTWVG